MFSKWLIQQVLQVRVTTALYQMMALFKTKASLRKLDLSHWKELAARFENTSVFLVKMASVLRGTNECKAKLSVLAVRSDSSTMEILQTCIHI